MDWQDKQLRGLKEIISLLKDIKKQNSDILRELKKYNNTCTVEEEETQYE